MARSIAIASGRALPSFGMARFFRGAVDVLQTVAAAGRVGAAYRDNVMPAKADLARSGLDGFEVLTRRHPV